MIGKEILHYKITAKLGEGGMGVVYKADDTRLDRIVAIKFLPREIASQPDERERFNVEAKASAALRHSNIATIHAIEEVDGELFIVMEYIEGQELKTAIEKAPGGQLDVETTIAYSSQIAAGLQAAHEKGVVHRDMKPANIIVTPAGEPIIMDFGLAKVEGGAMLTQVGTTLGTAAYMSPEQTKGDPIDGRTDIWSLGVMIYEMLAGERPFKGHYEQAIIFSILNEPPESLSAYRSDELPARLLAVIDKALAKEPGERYQEAAELVKDLQAIGSGQREEAASSDKSVAESVETPLPESAKTKEAPARQREAIPETAADTEQAWAEAGDALARTAESAASNTGLSAKKLVLRVVIPLAVIVVGLLLYMNFSESSDSTAQSNPAPGESNVTSSNDDETNVSGGSNATSVTHSPLILSLSRIGATATFIEKMNEYKLSMQIAVGNKDDFASPAGCYVFVADQEKLNGAFQFDGQAYVALLSGEKLTDLTQFAGQTSIWIQDLSQ